MHMESLGKGELEHDSAISSNKKLSDLISNLGNNQEEGEENVIEEEGVWKKSGGSGVAPLVFKNLLTT